LTRLKSRGGLSPLAFVDTEMVQKIKSDFLHPKATKQDKRRCLKYFLGSLSLAEVNAYAFSGQGEKKISKRKWGSIIREQLSGVFTLEDWGAVTSEWHFNAEDFSNAVNWSMGDDNIGYTSYGTHIVKDSANVPTLLGSNIRKLGDKDMYADYKNYTELHGMKSISKSNYTYLLLKCIGPHKETLLASLDSVYVKCGRHKFADIETFVNIICKGPSTANRKEPLLKIVGFVDQHIRSGIRPHLVEDSKCKWHSYSYLFDGTFAFPPEEEEHCEAFHNIFKLEQDIMDTINHMDEQCDFISNSRENKQYFQSYAKKLFKNLDTY
jgi:hypothetical protein